MFTTEAWTKVTRTYNITSFDRSLAKCFINAPHVPIIDRLIKQIKLHFSMKKTRVNLLGNSLSCLWNFMSYSIGKHLYIFLYQQQLAYVIILKNQIKRFLRTFIGVL